MTIFPDSNILIHFQPIENWIADIGTNEQLEIAVCLCIINELDKIKYSNNNNLIKRRVQQVVKKLGATSSLGDRNLPLILYMPDSINDIINGKALDKNDKDDVFIASVLNYTQAFPGTMVKILSNDLGVQLKCKTHKIEFIAPLEKYLIPEEDATEKEIRKLTRELSQMKNLQPKLRLQFANGKEHQTFDLEEPWLEYNEVIQEKMKEISAKYPFLEADPVSKKDNYVLTLSSLYEKTPEKVAKYNLAMKEFYRAYEIYLRKTESLFYKEKLTLFINIELSNFGNTPAEHVDVEMHFPDGFELGKKKDYYEKETEPSPPDLSSYSLAPIGMAKLQNYFMTPQLPNLNFGGLTITKTNSYDVKEDCEMLKHYHLLEFPALYITFDTFEEAKSFEITYSITAGNMIDIELGSLHVILNKIIDPDKD